MLRFDITDAGKQAVIERSTAFDVPGALKFNAIAIVPSGSGYRIELLYGDIVIAKTDAVRDPYDQIRLHGIDGYVPLEVAQ